MTATIFRISIGRSRGAFCQRRAGDREQEVERHHVRVQLLQAERQADAVVDRLAHAEDAAAARLQADLLRQPHRVDALLPGVRRDDLRVELLRRFQVVVDAADAGVLQVRGLLFVERAERGAVADAVDVLHRVDGFHDLGPFALRRAAAAVDDAEGAGAVVAGVCAGLGDLARRPSSGAARRRCRSGPTGAELAVLAAVAELRRQDAAERDAVAVEVAADLVGGVEEVVHVLALQAAESSRASSRVTSPPAMTRRDRASKSERIGSRHRRDLLLTAVEEQYDAILIAVRKRGSARQLALPPQF